MVWSASLQLFGQHEWAHFAGFYSMYFHAFNTKREAYSSNDKCFCVALRVPGRMNHILEQHRIYLRELRKYSYSVYNNIEHQMKIANFTGNSMFLSEFAVESLNIFCQLEVTQTPRTRLFWIVHAMFVHIRLFFNENFPHDNFLFLCNFTFKKTLLFKQIFHAAL